MIKKLFLILCALVLCSSSYAGNIKDIKKVIARKNAGCTIPDIGSPDINFSTTNGSNTLVSPNAEGQSFASGAGGKLARICVNIETGETDPVISVRIDSDTDMSDGNGYMEGWTSATLSTNGWVCFLSVDNDVYTAATTYYIAVNEDSGDAKWYHDTADGYGGGTDYGPSSGWTLGGAADYADQNFKIYWCD